MLKTESPELRSPENVPSLDRTNLSQRSCDLLRSELAKIRTAWTQYQETRDRDGVYHYLDAVFGLVGKWRRLGCAKSRARRALRLQKIQPQGKVEPFAALIACTGKLDRRTLSKWSRALRYVAQVKKDREGLARFMQGQGGINACASLFSRIGRQLRSQSQ